MSSGLSTSPCGFVCQTVLSGSTWWYPEWQYLPTGAEQVPSFLEKSWTSCWLAWLRSWAEPVPGFRGISSSPPQPGRVGPHLSMGSRCEKMVAAQLKMNWSAVQKEMGMGAGRQIARSWIVHSMHWETLLLASCQRESRFLLVYETVHVSQPLPLLLPACVLLRKTTRIIASFTVYIYLKYTHLFGSIHRRNEEVIRSWYNYGFFFFFFLHILV